MLPEESVLAHTILNIVPIYLASMSLFSEEHPLHFYNGASQTPLSTVSV